MSYVRTPFAYAWHDADTSPATWPSTIKPLPQPVQPAPTRWARRPWPVKARTELVGVRLMLGSVQVAVRSASGLRWAPADSLLTERQPRRWAANGFDHGRPR